ncbi:MAG TPA: ATP-binding protein [Polyangiaceae bacterium]|nr:ATP-binding protein [Polyangiaceae bacterium]
MSLSSAEKSRERGPVSNAPPAPAAPRVEWAPAGAAGIGAALGAAVGSGLELAPAVVGLLALVAALAGFATQARRARALAQRYEPGQRRSPDTGSSGERVRQRFLSLVADSVPDAVVLFSDVGTIQYSNTVARDLFFEGQNPEGQNFIRLVTAAAAPLREALLGETDRFFSVDVGGRRESYHLSRRTFSVEHETLTLLVVKYMTREIRRREVEVLQRVVRVISHEVNNSLAPISSLMHSARMMAQKLGHAEKYQRVFDTIDERATHLGSFLAGYAALARLPRPRLAETPWAPLIAQVATLYPEVQRPEPPALPGWFDGAQVEQMLINLIKNACEAGSALAAIELRVASEPDGSSELEVLDRGPGFSPEAMQNAVLPLYTTKPNGSGMGLALSREIAEAHGGSLDVSNRSDGGAWIRVRLAGRQARGGDANRSRLTLTRG